MNPPEKCDVCDAKIVDVFIDGATVMGPWAYLCPSCHRRYGTGLGIGRGQKYRRGSVKGVGTPWCREYGIGGGEG